MNAATALDVLEHADDLVRSRWRWGKGTAAYTLWGNRCAVESDKAHKFCAIGALWRARHELKLGRNDGFDLAQDYLARGWAEVLGMKYDPTFTGICIPVLNDNGTYREMKAAFARAKELARADVRQE